MSNLPERKPKWKLIAKLILISFFIMSCFYGVSLLLELGLKEKFEIKGPDTESNLIYITKEDRLAELHSVSHFILIWLSTSALLLVAGLYLLRSKK